MSGISRYYAEVGRRNIGQIGVDLVGITFLSGAEDAFFYETLQVTGRGDDYTRLVGRVSATFPGALALGSVSGGLLAAIDLLLPFLIAGLVLLITLGIVLTFKEPQTDNPSGGQARPSFGAVLRQSLAVLRARPTLRYPILYLAAVPLASFMLESVFVQPQALALGVPLSDLAPKDFAFPIATWTTSQFLTARAVARHMVRSRSGVILTLSASPARLALAMTGRFGVACAAVEGLSRTLGAELGPQGVRVVCLRPHRIGETLVDADFPVPRDEFIGFLKGMTLTKKLPTLADVANTAVFLASDHAAAISGAVANLTGGMSVD